MVVEPGAERVKELISAGARGAAVEVEVFDQPPGEGLEATLDAAGSIIGTEPFLLHLGESLCWDFQLDWHDITFGAADAAIFAHPTGHRHLGIYVVGSSFGAAAAAVPANSNLAGRRAPPLGCSPATAARLTTGTTPTRGTTRTSRRACSRSTGWRSRG